MSTDFQRKPLIGETLANAATLAIRAALSVISALYASRNAARANTVVLCGDGTSDTVEAYGKYITASDVLWVHGRNGN